MTFGLHLLDSRELVCTWLPLLRSFPEHASCHDESLRSSLRRVVVRRVLMLIDRSQRASSCAGPAKNSAPPRDLAVVWLFVRNDGDHHACSSLRTKSICEMSWWRILGALPSNRGSPQRRIVCKARAVMDVKLTLVERTIPRYHFFILKKVNETSEIPPHSSAAYAASVGENYVLAEPPRRRSVAGASRLAAAQPDRLTIYEEEEMPIATTEPTITEHEAAQVERANASNATPVVFVHGLWLLPSSWDRWVTLFEEASNVALTPGWPDDPETVAEAREHPEVFARKGIREIADYEEAFIRRLDRKPVIIGHSFGGLLTMILAGRGLAAASVAISPAPFRGVLPLPIAALRSASVALRNPANWNRAVPLSYEQFRYSCANAVGEDEAKELYLGYSVPGAGEPLFQAASANLNPWTEVKVDSKNPERGPMLIVSADSDQTVPWAIANAAYKKQKRNKGVTEIVKMPGRGHARPIGRPTRRATTRSRSRPRCTIWASGLPTPSTTCRRRSSWPRIT